MKMRLKTINLLCGKQTCDFFTLLSDIVKIFYFITKTTSKIGKKSRVVCGDAIDVRRKNKMARHPPPPPTPHTPWSVGYEEEYA